MNPKYRPVAALVLAGAVVIALASCSKDKKSTNTVSLTKDQQYAAAESLMVQIVPLTVMQFGKQFWDGVDAHDFGAENLAPFRLGKMTATTDSVSYHYDIARGWWMIFAQATVTGNSSGNGQLTLRDSVRFETQSGRAQASPNDSTYRLRLGSSMATNMEAASGDSMSLSIEFSGHTAADVTGLNDYVATINGNTDATLGFGVVAGANSANIGFNFNASINDLTMSTYQGDLCPSGGAMDVNLDLSVDQHLNGKHDSASGTWDVQLAFTGNRSADLDVHSGDYHVQDTVNICNP